MMTVRPSDDLKAKKIAHRASTFCSFYEKEIEIPELRTST